MFALRCCHSANRMGWLRRTDDGSVQLTGNRVRAFMDQTRPEQRVTLWKAWRDSPDWNDLCRTPGLECAKAGNWSNDPVQTRAAVLRILAMLQPGAWYSQSEVIDAFKEAEPDFQRPTGDYDTWYIRRTDTQEFLKGFDQWDAVEGELLRFLLRGPLHWLQAMDLAEPSAGDDYGISLSQWGRVLAGRGRPQPHESPRASANGRGGLHRGCAAWHAVDRPFSGGALCRVAVELPAVCIPDSPTELAARRGRGHNRAAHRGVFEAAHARLARQGGAGAAQIRGNKPGGA